MAPASHSTRSSFRPARPAALVTALALAGLGSLLGCSLKAPKQTGIMQRVQGVNVSAAELRHRVRSLAVPISGRIEAAADQASQSADPQRRRLLLLWKLNGIPAMHAALFHPDPFAALVDAAALLAQMGQYFQEGPGRAWPSEVRQPPLDALEAIRADLRTATVGIEIATVDSLRTRIVEWAHEHPLDSTFAVRPNPVGVMAQGLASNEITLGSAAGSLVEGMDDIAARLDFYAATVTKLARWHAELLLEDATQEGRLAESMDRVDLAADAVTSRVEEFPGLVAAERAIVLEAIREERIAALQSVTEERIALTADLRAERDIVLLALREERQTVLADVDRISSTRVEELAASLVDRLFLRLVQLLVAVAVVAIVGALGWRRLRPVGA